MLKIGDFARFTDTTVKTLHHYDEIGLLKPASIDSFTGYRYYTVAQMERMNRILALKDLGFPLEQITHLLDNNLSIDEISGMLKLRQAELQSRIEAEQARLDRVAARIRLMQQEGQAPQYEVIIKQVEAIRVLSTRKIIPDQGYIPVFFGEVMSLLKQHRIVSTGPWLALYHHGEYRTFDLDMEVAIPVGATVTPPVPSDATPEMCIRTLPPQTVASTVCHMESPVDVFESYQRLLTWIEFHEYGIADDPCREVYFETAKPGEPFVFETQLVVDVDRGSES
ncbi:MAG: MerR family transcriptional regulator [Chloroflexota bacterium]